MLTGNNYHDCNKYNRLEMKNVNKDIVGWLEEIVEEKWQKFLAEKRVSGYNDKVRFVS